MGRLLNIVTPSHAATKRDCLERMNPDKVRRMLIAEQYGKEYWTDPEGRYGYKDYHYIPDRQTPIAEALISECGLTPHSSVLDIGCGPGYLLYELTKLLPGIRVTGLDISHYALHTEGFTKPEVQKHLMWGDARGPLPFGDGQFDLIISINTLHNLFPDELPAVFGEIERVGYRSYVCVESYHERQSQTNVQCWALTCNSFFPIRSWINFYAQWGFTGDYEFVEF